MSSYLTLFPCHVSSSKNKLLCQPNTCLIQTVCLCLSGAQVSVIVFHSLDLTRNSVFIWLVFLARLDNCVCFGRQKRIFWNGKHSLLVGFFFLTHTNTQIHRHTHAHISPPHTHTHTHSIDSRVFPVGC